MTYYNVSDRSWGREMEVDGRAKWREGFGEQKEGGGG